MLATSLLAIAALTLAPADDAPPKPLELKAFAGKQPISFTRDVAEPLEAKCLGCHSSALAENKLNMEDLKGMLKGGKRGPALVPGKADASLIFTMAAHRTNPVMPPKDKKDLKPLTPEELGALKAWIDAGAKDDSSESAPVAKPLEIGALPPGIHPINALDLTADGRRVAAGRANSVQVYDVLTGQEIITLGGHKDLIQSVRYSSDAKLLAAGSYQAVTLWNAPTLTPGRAFTGVTEPLKAMILLKDGKTLITAGAEKSVRFWNREDGKTIRTIDLNSRTESLAISADEKTLFAGDSDGKLRRINLADGKIAATVPAHTGAFVSLVGAGDRLISAGRDGQTLVWNATDAAIGKSTGKIELGSGKQTTSIVLAQNNATAFIARDSGKIHEVALADLKTKRTLDVSSSAANAVTLSNDGKWLAVGSADKTVEILEVSSGKIVHKFEGLAAPVVDVAFSPDGSLILGGCDNTCVMIWEVASKRPVIAYCPAKQANAGTLKAQFASKNAIFTIAGSAIQAWTVEGSWSDNKTLGGHIFRVLAIDFSPDAKLIATGGGEPSRSGEVKIWEVATGKLVRTLETLHSDTVFGLKFSPDGKKLASAAADKFVKVINVADGKELKSFEGHTNHVLGVDWSGDGKKLVSCGADNVLKVWDFESGEQLRTLNSATKQVTSVRWVPGRPQVVGACGDPAVRAWNPDNGSVARTFDGPTDYMFAVAASTEGGPVAAGGADGVLFLWNSSNGQLIRKITPPSEGKK